MKISGVIISFVLIGFFSLAGPTNTGAGIEEIHQFNRDLSGKINSLAALKKQQGIVMATAEKAIANYSSHLKVIPEEIEALIRLMHNVAMVGVYADNAYQKKTGQLWKKLQSIITANQADYQLSNQGMGLREKLKNILGPEEFANFLMKYQDKVPFEHWKVAGNRFIIRPCDNYDEIGLINIAITCLVDLRKYYTNYDPKNKEGIEEIQIRLAGLYSRIQDEKKILELSRSEFTKNSDFNRQFFLLLYDRIIKDYKSSELRLAFLSDLVIKNKMPTELEKLVAVEKIVIKYLKEPKKETLEEFSFWLKSNDLAITRITKRRYLTIFAELSALADDWVSANRELKTLYDLDAARFTEINVLYCLSQYYVNNKKNSDECAKYGERLDKSLVSLDKIHWTAAKYRYLFMILNKKLSLKDRKGIRQYLDSPEVLKLKDSDPILQSLSRFYLAV